MEWKPFPDLEKELAYWINEKRQGGFEVSTNVIRLKSKVIAQKYGLPEGNFRALKSQCYRFMELHEFSIRRQTTVAQKLPKDYEYKLISFQFFVISKKRHHTFELKNIGNAGQTPLTFDTVTNSTVAEKRY